MVRRTYGPTRTPLSVFFLCFLTGGGSSSRIDISDSLFCMHAVSAVKPTPRESGSSHTSSPFCPSPAPPASGCASAGEGSRSLPLPFAGDAVFWRFAGRSVASSAPESCRSDNVRGACIRANGATYLRVAHDAPRDRLRLRVWRCFPFVFVGRGHHRLQ